MKKCIKIKVNNKVLVEEVELANHMVSRFMGLMFRKSMKDEHGLILIPCNQVHTFNMKFDIDVISLDKDNKVLEIYDSVKPNKVCKGVKNAKKVLELNPGIANKFGLSVGDICVFEQIN